LVAILSLFVVVGLAGFDADPSGCNSSKPTADQVTTDAQASLNKRGTEEVGIPNIVNFTQKRQAKRIAELLDQAHLSTVTYQYDLNGHLHFFCNSIGYPIPYATQYSSSERMAKSSEIPYQGNVTLPQSEPNGLFMPASADGTWVECINPHNPNQTGMVYSEPHVIASPWPMDSVK
jgi:hypothetical protein